MLSQVTVNTRLYNRLAATSGQPAIYTIRALQVGAQPSILVLGPVPFPLTEIVLELKTGASPLGELFTLDNLILDNTIAIGDRDGLLFVVDSPPALCSPATCP